MQHRILILFSALFFCLAGPLTGQILVEQTSVDSVFEVDLSDSFLDLELKTKITNTSDDTVRLKWTRLELDKPGEWDTQVCDNVECYIPIVSSNIDDNLGVNAPVILPPDSSLQMILYVLPNNTPGSGRIELDLALADSPDDIIETIVYLPDVRQATVTNIQEWLKPGLRMYPNPATSFFELTSSQYVDEVVITNMIGRRVASFRATEGKRYPVYNLPDGIYLVSLVNHEYGILRTLRLGKRGLRP